jgi:hypothetical protein
VPQPIPPVLNVLHAERGETLARRASDNDIDRWNLAGDQPMTDLIDLDDVSERRAVAGGGDCVHLDGLYGSEAASSVKSCCHAPRAGE